MLEVKVTQAHIDQGEQGNGYACPIALALEDKLGASVGDLYVDDVYVDINDSENLYSLGNVGEKFVKDFDNNRRVKPHTFRFKEIR